MDCAVSHSYDSLTAYILISSHTVLYLYYLIEIRIASSSDLYYVIFNMSNWSELC